MAEVKVCQQNSFLNCLWGAFYKVVNKKIDAITICNQENEAGQEELLGVC